jgi:sugar diacid utilization regulator
VCIHHAKALVEKFSWKTGISDKMDSFMDLRNGYKQADAALQLGRKKNIHQGYYRFSDYVVDYIMDRAAGELSAGNLLHPGELLHVQLSLKLLDTL